MFAKQVIDAQQAFRADLGEETMAPVVLKSLFDHTEAVTGLAFHSRARVLMSCSKVAWFWKWSWESLER